FDKYTDRAWEPATERVRELFSDAEVAVPTQDDWLALKAGVQKYGIYNQNLQAVPPTGSISYLNNSTASLHPVASQVEIRQERQGGQDRSRLLPGALPDQRQPGLLPGRVRDRLREDHRHVRGGHPARGPGAVVDPVLQGHGHHTRGQPCADLRVAQGDQDPVLHPRASARARGHRSRGLRLVHALSTAAQTLTRHQEEIR